MKLNEIALGDWLRVDSDFICLDAHEVRRVKVDRDGMYIDCRFGRHYLDGQIDSDGQIVGLVKLYPPVV